MRARQPWLAGGGRPRRGYTAGVKPSAMGAEKHHPAGSSPRPGGRLPSASFRLGNRIVHPQLNRIDGPEGAVQVEAKMMGVLLCLAEAAGQVVSRETLIEEIWEGAFVSDDVLTRSVVELRKVFADDSARPRIIETIRGRGYRLIAPVHPGGRKLCRLFAASPAARRRGRPQPRRRRWRWWAGALVVVAVGAAALAALTSSLFSRTLPRAPARVVPLTSYPGNEYDPAVAPDGSRVAFAWDGGEGGTTNLYVKLTNSEALLRLTDHPGHDAAPAWSPDGSRIAFARWTHGECRIMQVPAVGGPQRTLVPCGAGGYVKMDFSPDGRQLALTGRGREAGSPARIQLLEMGSPKRRDLTRPPASIVGDHAPAFSPDGRTVAFIRTLSPWVDDIYLVASDGGEPRRLTFDNRDVTGLDWSRDGRSIFFSSNRAGTYNLWRVPACGGEPQWVAGGGPRINDPSVAREAPVLAYESRVSEINIWRLPLAQQAGGGPAGAAPAGPSRLLLASTQSDLDPQYSPDGGKIAFSSTRSGEHEIWLADSDGGNPVQLTSFRGRWAGTPSWSPDGSRLVFAARPEEQADLYLAPIDGSPPRRLTSEPGNEVEPSWSADGHWIYFASRRTGSWEVWKVAVEGGGQQQVTTEGGYMSFESPDGTSLFYTKYGRPGIWRRSLEGGGESLFLADRGAGITRVWTVHDRGVYALQHSPVGARTLTLHPFAAADPVPLVPLPGIAHHSIAVSPDGRWVLYSRRDRRDSDIMLVEHPG